MKLKIIDDDGFIALVNGDQYQTFVDEDWELGQLMTHFVNQMNVGSIAIWRSSEDGSGNWLVEFKKQASDTHAYRYFDHFIEVTNGELVLTNYADLTMAAQFADQPIPAKHNADLKIEMENGWYKVTVRQLFDLDDDDDEKVSFEIIMLPTSEYPTQKVKNVFWFDYLEK